MNPSQIMKETLSIINKRFYFFSKEQKVLIDHKRFSKSTTIIPARSKNSHIQLNHQCVVIVQRSDSFDSVLWLITEKNVKQPFVLDFASDTNPGGGCESNQQGTQEESLCRRSTLFHSLKSTNYPIPLKGGVYVPEVCVFRSKDMNLLQNPFWCSIFASSLRSNNDKTVIIEKIELVFETAIRFNHDSLVLGAWGCGAFGNDPKMIADLFSQTIKKYKSCFKFIVFAITQKDMFKVFDSILSTNIDNSN